jgi:hydrogenase maturation protease
MGFGNPAREDDGLGPAIAEEIERLAATHAIEGVTVDADYQLTVTDAATVAEYDRIVFVDASTNCREPFVLTKIEPERQESFSSHSISPEGVMGLAEELFGTDREAYLLEVRGYSFAMFREEITERARQNKREAVQYLFRILRSRPAEASLLFERGDLQR